MRSRHVIGVGRHTAAGDLAVYMRTAPKGMFVLLQDKCAGTLAHDEAVAVGIERTRRMRGIVVARRQSLHGAESAHARDVYRRLRAACNHYIGLAQTYCVERVDNGMVGRSAGRGNAVVRPHESVLHGDMPRRQIGDHARNEEWTKPRDLSSLGIVHTFVIIGLDTSDAGAPNNAATLSVDRLVVETCVAHGLGGRYERILDERVVLAYLLAVEVPGPIVIFNLAGEPDLEGRSVESRDRSRTAHTVFQIADIFCDIRTQRVDRAQSRYDDSTQLHR
jgi:hypothetical protein